MLLQIADTDIISAVFRRVASPQSALLKNFEWFKILMVKFGVFSMINLEYNNYCNTLLINQESYNPSLTFLLICSDGVGDGET